MAKKNLTPREEAYKKRYLNKFNQVVSYQNVQDIKNYYKRNFPEEKQPKSIRDEIRTKTPEEIEQIANLGRKLYTAPLPESFVIDAAMSTNETTTDMRLSQAEAEGTKLFYKDKEVSKKELKQILQDYSDSKKEEAIEQDMNWYKTYGILLVDYENNKLTFDDDLEFGAIQDSPTDMKLFDEQQQWLKSRKQ